MPSNGAAELARIGARMKVEGEGALRLRTLRTMRAVAQPLVPAVKAAALRQLPKSGGLNVQVAGQKVSVSVSTAARTAGVRLKTTAPDTAQTDAGYVRHPVFGRRGTWVQQSIPQATGWWSKTLVDKAPVVSAALLVMMNETALLVEG